MGGGGEHHRIRISCGESKQSFWVRHHWWSRCTLRDWISFFFLHPHPLPPPAFPPPRSPLRPPQSPSPFSLGRRFSWFLELGRRTGIARSCQWLRRQFWSGQLIPQSGLFRRESVEKIAPRCHVQQNYRRRESQTVEHPARIQWKNWSNALAAGLSTKGSSCLEIQRECQSIAFSTALLIVP